MMKTIDLRTGRFPGRWELQDAQGTDWLPAQVPGTAHEALLGAGRIPDPFFGLHERDVQWVGERSWRFRCRFVVQKDFIPADGAVVLGCEGLDTLCTGTLNGHQVLRSENMFLPVQAQVTGLLVPGDNELELLFEPVLQRARALAAAHGAMRVWNGDASRVYVRKAQYHFGWDWGPTLLCAGPYRPVRLSAYQARICDLRCLPEVSPDLGRATLPVHVGLDGPAAAGGASRAALALRLVLREPSGRLCGDVLLPAAGLGGPDDIAHSFHLDRPELWWPHGQGGQGRYLLEVTLLRDGVVQDRQALRLGLRRLRLLKELQAGLPGESFVFEINGREVFCGGANWIPADSLLPMVTPARYRALVQMARDAHMNMLRVWGGGVYEDDVFYDLCDELGLLVWQDFMFACGLYPAEQWFLDSVRAEAEAAVRRLRHHPCLALWCGNNEDYSLASSVGAYAGGGGGQAPRFPGRAIYEETLAQVCSRLDPARPYWPGSPYTGAEDDPNGGAAGDRHTWEVWHGQMADYQDYGRFSGRFVSEFGMQAFPAVATLVESVPHDQRAPQSEAVRWHNKAEGGPDRLAHYLARNLPLPKACADGSLEDYVYATQLMQAEALGWAFRLYRRCFGRAGQRGCGGALVWQLDDCWPAVSWSLVDYVLRKKAAYYAVRRALAEVSLGLRREGGTGSIAVWLVNGGKQEVKGTVTMHALDEEGGLLCERAVQAQAAPGTVVELGTMEGIGVAWRARLLGEPEQGAPLLARTALFREPLRELPGVSGGNWDPGLRIEAMPLRKGLLRLTVERPAKGVWLEVLEATVDGGRSAPSRAVDVDFSDNSLDLLPGDEQMVQIAGVSGTGGPLVIRARWLGQPAGSEQMYNLVRHD